MDISFSFHHKWKEEEHIARRIAMVIIGHDQQGFPLFEIDTVNYLLHRWRLDSGNDWFLRIDMENHTATLSYRYSSEHNAEFMQSLRNVLFWVFD